MPGPTPLPSYFGRYRVLGDLGAGSMGRVYLGVDERLGRPVAIKVLRLPADLVSAPADFEARFRREAEAAGRLNHPNIVQIFDVGPNFFVMEYIEGQALKTLLKGRRPMSLGRVTTIVSAVAEAVDFAHAHGIVHRDVKPANVMIANDGTVKVMDFGVARLEDSKLTVAGTVVGSVQYMAPEQMTGGPIDGRADVFSLAAVAYEMLTGQAPFPGKTITEVVALAIQEKFTPPRSVDSRLPEAINRVFRGALTREPSARYQKAASFASDLRSALEPVLDLAATPPVAVEPTGGPGHVSIPTPPGGTLFVDAATLATLDDEMRREAVLILESDPPGARVFVDGYEVGETPIAKLDTRLGHHKVAFERDGHDPVSANVELTSDRPLRLVSATLPPLGAGRAVFPGKLVPMGPNVIPPVRVSGRSPGYPEDARSRGLGGTCVVEFWVSETGEPRDVVIVQSAGPTLDASAVEGISSWRFTPARLGGVPVSVRLSVHHVFSPGGSR